jgi:caspase domain-containing protein
MGQLLEQHEDERPNYDSRILLDQTEKGAPITMAVLREACSQLFADTKDDVLLYFSGHGALNSFGGYLCAYDSVRNNLGVPMQEIMQMAYDSRARDILMILDCCHSGDLGNSSILRTLHGDLLSTIRTDMTVIAASQSTESSFEGEKYSVFTAALIDALRGGAADRLGWVTAPSIYAYVERRFSWKDRQRPIYKTNATGISVIRQCTSHIDRFKLRRLVELFEDQSYQYRLDPEYEPYDKDGNLLENVNQEKHDIALLFKSYRDAGLLIPTNSNEQLYHTALYRNTVQLTPLGREYWWLVKNKKI